MMTRIEKIKIGEYIFPDWTLVTGTLMTSSALIGIIAWAIYAILDALFIKKMVIYTFTININALI